MRCEFCAINKFHSRFLQNVFTSSVHVHGEFSASLERVKLYPDDSIVTRTRFRVFRATKHRLNAEKKMPYTPPINYPSNSLYLETNFAVT